MAYREVSRVEIAEVVRCWQSGESQRQIASGTGLSRKTVRRYIRAGVEAGLTRDGPVPSEDQLTRLVGLTLCSPRRIETPTDEKLAPWADQVYAWLTADRLQVTRIHELLAARGCEVSLRVCGAVHPSAGLAETKRHDGADGGERTRRGGGDGLRSSGPDRGPGDGSPPCGMGADHRPDLLAAQLRLPTFSQKLVDVIEGLEAAWAFFEGVPNYLVIDNFPAAVAGVDPLHPRLTRGFLEYSQHRGFISDPARVRHPRDKPRVERGVPYVRERFFKGGEFTGLSDMRSAARRWCLEVAGQRIHGTTRKQPLAVFRQEERHTLGEWDAEPYEMTDWRTAKVHPDHHIACQYALYSVPSATCPPGQKVEVRLSSKLVRIYHRGRLIKVHPRQDRGGRSTDPDDYPAELSAYTLRAPEQIKRSAASQGPAVAAYAERLFDGPLPWAKLRQGHKLIRLENATPLSVSMPHAGGLSQ